jgi:hypothetical protein
MPAFVLTVLAAAYLLAQVLIIARRRPRYSHIRHTISELGEFGAAEQRFVAGAVFLPVGAVLLIVGALARPLNQSAALLALCIAIGYLVAAAFPCDPGSPLSGSFRQALHNLGGAVEYVGGGVALLLLSETLGPAFRLAGFVVLGAAIALSVPGITAIRGVVQRAAELCLFVGLALAIWLSHV